MAYCSAEDVIDMIKDDLMNQIIGNSYIEDVEERKAALRRMRSGTRMRRLTDTS